MCLCGQQRAALRPPVTSTGASRLVSAVISSSPRTLLRADRARLLARAAHCALRVSPKSRADSSHGREGHSRQQNDAKTLRGLVFTSHVSGKQDSTAVVTCAHSSAGDLDLKEQGTTPGPSWCLRSASRAASRPQCAWPSPAQLHDALGCGRLKCWTEGGTHGD